MAVYNWSVRTSSTRARPELLRGGFSPAASCFLSGPTKKNGNEDNRIVVLNTKVKQQSSEWQKKVRNEERVRQNVFV